MARGPPSSWVTTTTETRGSGKAPLAQRFERRRGVGEDLRARDLSLAQLEDPHDRLLDPVRDCLTPEVAARIAALRADAAAQARLDDLADRNRDGTIGPDELAEYDALVRAAGLIAVLQAKARTVLAGS